METITLQQVLPAVFAETGAGIGAEAAAEAESRAVPRGSDVWLREITFRKGEKYLVEAASGGGKSSLFTYIYGYRQDYSGRILFDLEEDVRGLAFSRWNSLRRRSLAMLFQDLRLFPELSVLENVELKNNITRFKTSAGIAAMFGELGIDEKLNAPVAKLSFGQQQRVAFIRTLCQPADFILLDEPVSHIDDRNSQAMASMLAREAAAQGAGVIVSSIGKTLEIGFDKTFAL